MVVSITIKYLGCTCANKEAVLGNDLESNKALMAATRHNTALDNCGI